MGHQRRIPEIERLQQLLRPFGVTPDRVDLRPVRLVGAPGTEEVENDHPIAGLDQRGDEVAVQVPPGRVAVDHHHRPTLAGPRRRSAAARRGSGTTWAHTARCRRRSSQVCSYRLPFGSSGQLRLRAPYADGVTRALTRWPWV